jgi:hypothetical protein
VRAAKLGISLKPTGKKRFDLLRSRIGNSPSQHH